MQQSRGNREARLKLVLTDAVDNAPIIYKHWIILLLLMIIIIFSATLRSPSRALSPTQPLKTNSGPFQLICF